MKNYVAAVVAILFSVIGCASVNVSTEYSDETDFSAYKTYRFQKPDVRGRQKAVNNPIFATDVLQEIKGVMTTKGFTEAESDEKADLTVIFYAHTEKQTDWVPGTYRVGRWGRVHQATPGHTVRYKTGTLVIDIVDQAKKELVWQGVGEGVVSRNDPSKKLVEAVSKILEKFPPTP